MQESTASPVGDFLYSHCEDTCSRIAENLSLLSVAQHCKQELLDTENTRDTGFQNLYLVIFQAGNCR